MSERDRFFGPFYDADLFFYKKTESQNQINSAVKSKHRTARVPIVIRKSAIKNISLQCGAGSNYDSGVPFNTFYHPWHHPVSSKDFHGLHRLPLTGLD